MGTLLSMTGYGNAKGRVGDMEVTVELKSVNNRYMDCSVRLPRTLLFAEDGVKKTVTDSVSRGKVDVFVTSQATESSDTVITVNHALAREYFAAVSSIAEELSLPSGLDANTISRFPDVLTVEKKELDREAALASLAEITKNAIAEFNTMRAREGERLKTDMLGKLTVIEELVSRVEERSPRLVGEYRERLEAKLREVLEDKSIDEQRIITECALFADRTAVDEETVRLRSHIQQFRAMLDAGSPVGRKLDFLIQEFNRESNTIGSKCNDAELARVVVDLKSEIEKIREQLQNIE